MNADTEGEVDHWALWAFYLTTRCKKQCSDDNAGSATVPTAFGGHGGPPYIYVISGFI